MHETSNVIPGVYSSDGWVYGRQKGRSSSADAKREDVQTAGIPVHDDSYNRGKYAQEVEQFAYILCALKADLFNPSEDSAGASDDASALKDTPGVDLSAKDVSDVEEQRAILPAPEDPETDDEWNDFPTHRPLQMTRNGPRKKAPSGAACEKHKRWKKRCPDDCPFRSPKFRSARQNQDSSDDDFEYSSVYDDDGIRVSSRGRAVGRKWGKRPNGSTACIQHTELHLRCPPNCPNRRPMDEATVKRLRFDTDLVEQGFIPL